MFSCWIEQEKLINFCITAVPAKVVFNDICQVLMETLSSKAFWFSVKGKVLGCLVYAQE